MPHSAQGLSFEGLLWMAMGTGLRRTLDLVGIGNSLGMRDGVHFLVLDALWLSGYEPCGFRPPPHLSPGLLVLGSLSWFVCLSCSIWKPSVTWVLGCTSSACEACMGGAKMELLGREVVPSAGHCLSRGLMNRLCLCLGGSSLLSRHLVRRGELEPGSAPASCSMN